MIIFIATVSFLVSVVQQGNCGEVCQTPECINSAAWVKESMTVGPCDDFYEFACRGWIMKNPIRPNEQIISTIELVAKEIQMKLHQILNATDNDKDGKPIKLARALYRTCMDMDNVKKLGIKPLHDLLTKVGLPHAPPTDEEAKNLDFPKIVGLAIRHFGYPIFFDIVVDENSTDSTKNKLTIQQKSPGFSDFDTYLRQPVLFKEVLLAQRNNLKSLFTTGGAGIHSEEYTTELMDFLIKIAKTMGTPAEMVRANYSRVMTIDELQEITDPHGDKWNWTKYFDALFDQTDVVFDSKTDTIFLHDVSYVKNLILLMKETGLGTTARYIWWEIFFIFLDRIYHPFLKLQRWEICMLEVNKIFEPALTAAYVDKHFDVQYKKKAMEMWADLNSTLDEMIDELDWMDAETKAHAHVKLHAMTPAIGYPDWITNPEELNKYFEPFEVLEGRLFDTYTQHQLIRGKRLLNSWKQMPDKNQWKIAGTSVTATYANKQNAVAISAGLLHFPVCGNGVESLNYGAIGSMMGTQLVQTIDNLGGETDENGNNKRWWSDQTSKPYLEKISCVVKQYTDLVIHHQGHNLKLNGTRIQHGSIAIMAGLKIAFRAYQKFKARSEPQKVLPALDEYTDEQLLFLGFAQAFCGSETIEGLNKLIQTSPFPPNHYMIIGTLQNSEEFAKAWNCSRGSPMNPENTCTTIW